jgi:hypothetical protein
MIKVVFCKVLSVFFALPLASPSVVFPVMLFVPTHKRHIVFFLLIELFLAVKAKSQRAAPTLQTKRHARKKQPKAILT